MKRGDEGYLASAELPHEPITSTQVRDPPHLTHPLLSSVHHRNTTSTPEIETSYFEVFDWSQRMSKPNLRGYYNRFSIEYASLNLQTAFWVWRNDGFAALPIIFDREWWDLGFKKWLDRKRTVPRRGLCCEVRWTAPLFLTIASLYRCKSMLLLPQISPISCLNTFITLSSKYSHSQPTLVTLLPKMGVILVTREAAMLIARDGDNALSNFFGLPVILGLIAVIVFLVGLACLIRIGMAKDNSNGRTIPM